MKPRTDGFYKRHHDDEIIDDVRIVIVTRWKDSDASGSEWRVSAITELRRKGTLLVQHPYHTMRDAVAHLPWLLRTWSETLEEEATEKWLSRIDQDKVTCHQPGCSEPSAVVYRLREEFSPGGDRLDARDLGDSPQYRSFCRSEER